MDKPPPTTDSFDPERFRLPPGCVGELHEPARLPRHRRGEAFIKGPIPWDWWAAACRLPGHSLHVASAIRYRAGWNGPEEIPLGLSDMDRSLGVGRGSARLALRHLEGGGLVSLVYASGCKPSVSIVERGPGSADGQDCRTLRGPIPWDWWVKAARLPGRSLHVASVLWFLVGASGGHSATRVVGLAEWAELGLTRQSAARGLEYIERVGLVSVIRREGCKPVVTLLEG